jgi:hypothetical protein
MDSLKLSLLRLQHEGVCRMTTQDFMLTRFCQIDDQRAKGPKRPDAKLYPSEVVRQALLFAITGVGPRAFDRWLRRDDQAWFPHVPERTRVGRLFKTPAAWTAQFLAAPTVLGVADSDGREFIQPMRAGRSPHQIGKKGKSHQRWIGGGKRWVGLKQWGGVCAWDGATANVHDAHVHPLIAPFVDTMSVLTDTGFHAKTGDPMNMKVCPRGTWNGRRLVETIFSLLPTVFHGKKVRQRVWEYVHARVAWTMAAFHLLAQWGLEVDDHHFTHLSIAEFSL